MISFTKYPKIKSFISNIYRFIMVLPLPPIPDCADLVLERLRQLDCLDNQIYKTDCIHKYCDKKTIALKIVTLVVTKRNFKIKLSHFYVKILFYKTCNKEKIQRIRFIPLEVRVRDGNGILHEVRQHLMQI